MNGYAIFLNGDGTETKLSWKELKLEENAEKYGYDIYQVNYSPLIEVGASNPLRSYG